MKHYLSSGTAMIRSHLFCHLLFVFSLLFTATSTLAQCEFQEVMRADGTLIRNYEYASVFTSDSMSVRMSLAYQGAFKTLRVEFTYSDTVRTRFYKDIDLKMSDSTVLKMIFISSARESSTGTTTCLYEIHQKDLGYLTTFEIVYFVYRRKDGSQATFPITENRDILIQQLACTRKK